jgi:hypothetical protein
VVSVSKRARARREHAVAEQLHDAAAVYVDGGGHRAVVAVHQPARGLGVEAFVQRDRADQIGEHDRDDLARDRIGRGVGALPFALDQCRAAPAAEARAGRVRLSAARAIHRVRSVAAPHRRRLEDRLLLPKRV